MKNFLNPQLIHSRITPLLMVFVFSSLSTPSMSAVPVTEDHFSIGGAGVFNSATYKGMDGFATAMPLFDIQYGRYFLFNNDDEPVIGMELLRGTSVTLSVAATYGRTFLDIKEINEDRKFVYFGLKNRDRSIDLGLTAKYFSRLGLIEATLFHDVSGESKGIHSSLSISRPIPGTGNKWSYVPRFYAKYYSAKFNNFYYGVTEEENIKGINILLSDLSNLTSPTDYLTIRPAYSTGVSGHLGVDLDVTYSFSKTLKGKGYFSYENYTGPVETSPLAEDKALYITSIGLSYEF